ncbi:hypothetical protein Tco_0170113 [Tanacetum coccineum]
MEDDSWTDIILDDVYNTFYRDEEEEETKGKGKEAEHDHLKVNKEHDKGKGKQLDDVDLDDHDDDLDAHDDDLDAFDLEKLESKSLKRVLERPTTSRAPTAFTSTRSRALTASTSNAQVASTLAPRGRKIAMRGCILGLRALNDPNAPPPSATRKRKSKK